MSQERIDSVDQTAGEFCISRSAEPKSARFKVLFSLQDWVWPLTALGCACLGVVLTTTVSGSPESFTVKSNPYAFFGLVFVIVVATIKWRAHRKAKHQLREVAASHAQFIEFNCDAIRYGWEGVVLSSWSWDTIAHAKLSEDVLILRMGTHRLRVDLALFSSEEIDALQTHLRLRQLIP